VFGREKLREGAERGKRKEKVQKREGKKKIWEKQKR
jgi:hypothetical protein